MERQSLAATLDIADFALGVNGPAVDLSPYTDCF